MTARYITDESLKLILLLLDEWASGKLGSGLSWAILEKAFGYSRQALSGNPQVKAKFKEAKEAIKTRKLRSSKSESVDDELDRLRTENEALKAQVLEYEKRFMRWMQNCYKKGINPIDLDNPIGVSLKTLYRARDMQ